MFSSRTTDHLAFVSRQLASLSDDQPIEAALDRLKEVSPEEYANDVEYFRRLLAGDASKKAGLGPNPYRAIARFLPSVGDQKNTLFRAFVDFVRQSKVIFETYWVGIIGLMSYLAAVAFIALIVGLVFWRYVIPSFGGMFTNFGSELPEYTKVLFAFGKTGLPLFAVALLLLVAAVVIVVSMFHKRIQQLSPLPRWPVWAPIIGRVAEIYNFGLFLNYARMLRECGVDPEHAVRDAAAASNQPESLTFAEMQRDPSSHEQLQALTELGIAAKLGNFDAELEHQCDQHVAALSLTLVEARDRFSILLKTALFVFVGALVVAMYLPIFQMGSVV
ncbi:MAG: hypothetical protein QNI99_02365 [Woeseiaceae bacterium]|nr:hypothetical protein [Woeseiaceae bacterium]